MSQIATIKIELLSESIFAGDGEQRGSVDIDLQRDEYGFPFYAGRTLKGILREQAEWYVDCLAQFDKHEELRSALYRLFGQPDDTAKEIHHSNHTSLRFADAKMAQSMYDVVLKKGIPPQEVFQALTTVRTMTSMDRECGTAEAGSLRQVRVMHEGYTLYAPIYVYGELSTTEKDLLETAVQLVRYIGLMRNRGKGHVRCSLQWNKRTFKKEVMKQRVDNQPPEAGDYIVLNIHVHEPLKISHVLGTSDASRALHYIPGYVLRGAFVQAYLQATGLSPNDLDTQVIFDHNQVQFWNGYLQVNNQRGLPFAQHLFEPKKQSKLNTVEQIRSVVNSLERDELAKISYLSPVRVRRDVMLLTEEDKLIGKNVKKVSALHISVNGNRANPREIDSKTQIYRYEAIAPNQTFQAIVAVKTEHHFTSWLRKQRELELWLGGARNSGYGRVTVQLSRTSARPEQPSDCFKVNSELKELYILATSDWIIRNQQGQLVSTLDIDWLNEQLGVGLHLNEQIVNTDLSGGYVSLWKAYQPMISSVQAGSIYRYTIANGKLDMQRILALIDKGVGARRNEGFGRLVILPTWPYRSLQEDKDAKDEERQMIAPTIGSSQNDMEQVIRFATLLTKEKILGQVRQQVHEWKQNLTGQAGVNSSQWGKLLQITSELLTYPNDEQKADKFRERWQVFWEESRRRLENKSKLGFQSVRINNKSLEEFTLDIVEHSWPTNQYIDQEIPINHAYWSMRAFELFLHQIIRSLSKTEEGAGAK